MTGHQLHTMLCDTGATLHLDPQGKLSVKPKEVAQRYKAAIQQHLCFLLVCAAIQEVKRLLAAQMLADVDTLPLVSTQMLNAAAVGGDVETTRQAAVAYVNGWREAVQGAKHAERV